VTARRPPRGDRGVTIVEAAIAFPVFFLVVLGIIEFGFFMAASSGTTSATRNGARVGSAELAPASDKATAADKVRDRVADDLDSLTGQDSPVRLWVYKAFTDGSPCADLACGSGTDFASCPDTVCYRYTGWDAPTGTFTARDGSWTTVDACPPTLDTVGVHLQVVHDYLSGVLGDSTTLNEKTVLRLEPLPIAQCAGP
jgi:Flp pilus assembly protein TadG